MVKTVSFSVQTIKFIFKRSNPRGTAEAGRGATSGLNPRGTSGAG
jgi:hypothetical protein